MIRLKRQYSSIFNDVLGPVMCGPSSSHTAASVRVGKLLKQMLPGKSVRFTAEFDPKGTIAPCYHSQCVDTGLAGGILGFDTDDERVLTALVLAEEAGLELNFVITPLATDHPNTYQLTLENEAGERVHAEAISVGGGMIEFVGVEGYPVSIAGGFYETLLFFGKDWGASKEEVLQMLTSGISMEKEVISQEDERGFFFEIRTEEGLPEGMILGALNGEKPDRIIFTEPILPVVSQLKPHVAFEDGAGLLALAKSEGLSMAQVGVRYESIRGHVSEDEIREKMKVLVGKMKKSLESGLAGTEYEKRILGAQSKYFEDGARVKRLIQDDITNEIIRCVSALMEVKSSLGVFVAAPTAGACGAAVGTILAVARKQNLRDEEIADGMFAAGIMGVLLAEKATFAAELAGCQAECGSGSGMTAAALTQLQGGTAEECCGAASMALQNVFGMTCDSLAMAVEVPCLGKNILAGVNALTSANMALLGYDPVVPLDETLEAFNEAGRMIPLPLRCTGGAGLSCTPTSRKMEQFLFGEESCAE